MRMGRWGSVICLQGGWLLAVSGGSNRAAKLQIPSTKLPPLLRALARQSQRSSKLQIPKSPPKRHGREVGHFLRRWQAGAGDVNFAITHDLLTHAPMVDPLRYR